MNSKGKRTVLKQTVHYLDFNDQPQTEDLYFHLTRSDVMENLLPMLPRLEAFQAKAMAAGDRNLTPEEVLEFLQILKVFIGDSYGIRDEDGKHFRKKINGVNVYDDFRDSAAYDAFLMSLFEDLEKANKFLTGILPKSLLEQIAQETANGQNVETIKTGGELNATSEEVPAYIRENREPTQRELASMSPDQLQEAFRRKIQQQ